MTMLFSLSTTRYGSRQCGDELNDSKLCHGRWGCRDGQHWLYLGLPGPWLQTIYDYDNHDCNHHDHDPNLAAIVI